LGRKVQPPQRHAKQEPQPGHDPVAIADARTCLRKVQLEAANVLGGCYVGGTVEKCREALAAVDVAPLRVLAQLARIHVLEQSLTQGGDSRGFHCQLLSWVSFRNTSILKTGRSPRYQRSLPWG